ncbi:MAG: prepilin-type N-terminal cleavage/methylation domain-containing protein [Candidatus Brocadiaceae bacterium]|uniref:type IV pilus modification PilV family protein n=1 Tax=Candidatus Wunengus sp. YC61 TaxID=3367698 RepID=UPI002716A943|nr:prepilin-type N-terminal cleavage/methylation domain-containing protein [Candidatus Brocadiaceae bacterium]
MRNIKVVNKNGVTPVERKLLHLWWGERNRKFECGLRSYPNFQTGFTILEVMVALAIMGISIGIFFGLVGNSSKLRGKIDEHTKIVLLARTKTEEAFLGILGKKYAKLNEEKTFEGVTKDGVQWKISQVDKYKEARKKITMDASNEDESDVELPPKGTTMLSTHVEGININTIFFVEESEEDENDTEGSVEENDGGKSGKEMDD